MTTVTVCDCNSVLVQHCDPTLTYIRSVSVATALPHAPDTLFSAYRNFTTRSQSGTFSLLQTLVFYTKTKNTQKKRVSYMKKMLEGEGGVFNKNLGVRTPVSSPANWCMWPVTLHLNWTGLLQGTKTKNQNFENTHLHTSPRFWTFKKKKKKKKCVANNTRCSQAVTHPSTNRARRCLTSVIRREPVFSTWYGRWR